MGKAAAGSHGGAHGEHSASCWAAASGEPVLTQSACRWRWASAQQPLATIQEQAGGRGCCASSVLHGLAELARFWPKLGSHP
jgi:hypothetical protein